MTIMVTPTKSSSGKAEFLSAMSDKFLAKLEAFNTARKEVTEEAKSVIIEVLKALAPYTSVCEPIEATEDYISVIYDDNRDGYESDPFATVESVRLEGEDDIVLEILSKDDSSTSHLLQWDTDGWVDLACYLQSHKDELIAYYKDKEE